MQKSMFYWALGLGLAVFVSRIIPHMPNFTASSAAIVFAASQIRRWPMIFSILIAYFAADLVLNNLVYPNGGEFKWISGGAFYMFVPLLINYGIIKFTFSNGLSPLQIISASFISAVVFFLISNFGVFLHDSLYPKTVSGLFACYLAAIPFFAYELVGTLFFTTVFYTLFGLSKGASNVVNKYA